MERRRIELEEDKQLALPLAPGRRRVDDDTEVVTLRMAKEDAAIVSANPAGAVAALQKTADKLREKVAERLAAGSPSQHPDLTDFSRARPPCSGWWELKQQSARRTNAPHWWYDPATNLWSEAVKGSSKYEHTKKIDHGTLMLSHEWCGLRQRAIEGYPYKIEYAAFAGDYTPPAEDVQVEEGPRIFTPEGFKDLNPAAGARRRVEI